MTELAKILIDIFNLIFLSCGCLSSIIVLILIIYHRHQHRINSSMILVCNTYFFFFLSSLILIDTYTHNLYGDFYENISFNSWWCYARGYLLQVVLGSIYLSFLLQAIFRLFRIVFYRYKYLQKFQFICFLIFLQWLLAFLITSPALFLHFIEYIEDIYYCGITLIDLKGTIFGSISTYYGPTLITTSIYSYIMYYIKYKMILSIQSNRHRSNQRDLIVLRRIIILVGTLLVFLVPPGILWLIYVITGYLHPLIYHIEGLTISTLLITLPLASTILNPQLFNLIAITYRRNRRIHPVIILQQQQENNQTNTRH